MEESAYLPRVAVRAAQGVQPPPGEASRHPMVVRVTHWLNALSFAGLLVSGIAILLAHPRLYWGETGAVGMPSWLDLPLPFMLTGQTGWGRSLHFQSAWVCVVTGIVYVVFGVSTQHFREGFARIYEPLQRRTYALVVFVLFPIVVWTGLAMSPAVTSVFPAIVNVFGGHQSARTIHFFAAALLLLFLIAHLAMVTAGGFVPQVRAMITGRAHRNEGEGSA